jgi:hypothetical protein
MLMPFEGYGAAITVGDRIVSQGPDVLPFDLPPAGPSLMTNVCGLVHCSPSLDRKNLDFPGFSL